MQIDNKSNNVIITGGTQGLGLSIAKNLILNGCKNLLLLGRDEEKGLKAAKHLNNKEVNCFYKKCDVSVVEDCMNAFDYGVNKFGIVNSLINVAAVTTRGSILDTSIDLWEEIIFMFIWI